MSTMAILLVHRNMQLRTFGSKQWVAVFNFLFLVIFPIFEDSNVDKGELEWHLR